jgi:MFS transporter, FHS family, L-fucose permease
MTQQKSGYTMSLIIIGALFFVFGFITWLNGILIPYLKISCELTYFQSYLVTFAFYISYFVMALPSGWVLKKTGLKNGMSLGLLLMSAGALLFIPAAYSRNYLMFLLGLFVMGTGLALLQTASNPYITIIGPLESAAKRISIMGIANKIAGALAPLILAAVVLSGVEELTSGLETMSLVEKNEALDILSQKIIPPYIVIMISLLVLGILVKFSPLPELEMENNNPKEKGKEKKYLLQYPNLLFGVLTMFLYVGAEVIAGDTVIQYAISQGYPVAQAKIFTSVTLAMMIVGYLVGIAFIPKYIKQEIALFFSALLGILLSLAVIFLPGKLSVIFVSLLGLSNALVWPAIWPMAIKGLGRHTSLASSVLIMAIAGGAILPLVYGSLSDSFSTQQAYAIVIPCYLGILMYAWVFKPKDGQ